MNEIDKYEFDRQGFLVIKELLTAPQVALLRVAIDAMEEHATAQVALPPRKIGYMSLDYHVNAERGYYVTGSRDRGKTLIIEDFFNFDSAFDCLVNHGPSMSYVRDIVVGPIRINNSEIRIRYPGNATGTHMGGPIDHKYRYSFTGGRIDAMMIRMIYFVDDVALENGAFSVVPGTHKTNYKSPYDDPYTEPGMIGLEVKAGDGILFTENLRHGGLINNSEKTRKTLHVGYGPAWMMSQNAATFDEPQNITADTLGRYDEAQRRLFVL